MTARTTRELELYRSVTLALLVMAASTSSAIAQTYSLPTYGRQKSISMNTWENTMVAIPPNQAGCGSNGALLVSRGMPRPEDPDDNNENPMTRRISAVCMTSGTAFDDCGGTTRQYQHATYWPAIVDNDNWNFLNLSADNQIVRLGGNLQLLLRQGPRQNKTGPQEWRGAEYFFRTTNCGSNWTYNTVLDPKTDGPSGNTSRCHDPSSVLGDSNGHDRPELYADPFIPGRVYMTTACVGPQANDVVLFRSNDSGLTWTYVTDLGPASVPPATMTSTRSGRLYLFYPQRDKTLPGEPLTGMALTQYYPPTGAKTTFTIASSETVKAHPTKIGWGSSGIARVGNYSEGDYLRVHYPVQLGSDYGIEVDLVLFAGGVGISYRDRRVFYGPFPGQSLVGAQSIETDRVEYPDTATNGNKNPSAIYWYYIKTAKADGHYGPATAGYAVFPPSTTSLAGPTGYLSLGSNGASRFWPIFEDTYGDYQKGGFYYNSSGRMRFFFMWGEQAVKGPSKELRTNYLYIDGL